MISRRQHQKQLEFRLTDKIEAEKKLTTKINASIGFVSSDEITEMCQKRNNLQSDIHTLTKQVHNLQNGKCFLGDVVKEINESGNLHTL